MAGLACYTLKWWVESFRMNGKRQKDVLCVLSTYLEAVRTEDENALSTLPKKKKKKSTIIWNKPLYNTVKRWFFVIYLYILKVYFYLFFSSLLRKQLWSSLGTAQQCIKSNISIELSIFFSSLILGLNQVLYTLYGKIALVLKFLDSLHFDHSPLSLNILHNSLTQKNGMLLIRIKQKQKKNSLKKKWCCIALRI